MKTTNYLIELIIAGLSTLLWVSLLVLSIVDLQTLSNYDFFNRNIPYITIAAISLPFVYIVGVIVDRIFDSLFDDLLLRNHNYKYLKSQFEYDLAKAKIYLSNESLVDKFEYYRTKIRICRTWIFNSILIWISLLIFLWCHKSFPTQYDRIFFIITMILPASAFLSFIAWKRLIDTEDKFLHHSIKEIHKQGKEINKKGLHNVEIERKYVVKMDHLPIDLNKAEFAIIKQWYISKIPVIRIRNINDKYILGIKSRGLIKRIEHEISLTDEEFENIKGLIHTKVIEKYRYNIRLEGGYLAEVDVFKTPPYENLVTVEVEFESMEDAGIFDPPKWFGQDISNDPKYKNSYMAFELKI